VADADGISCSDCPLNAEASVDSQEQAKTPSTTNDTESGINDGRRRLRSGSSGGTSGGTSAGRSGSRDSVSGGDGGGAAVSGGGGIERTNFAIGCSCVDGYYNTSRAAKCHGRDHSAAETPTLQCETCHVLSCVTDCHGERLNVTPGWALKWRVDGTTSIFQCKYDGACPGGVAPLNEDSACSEGYEGTLCGVCASNHTIQQSGECVACGATTWVGIVCVVLGLLILAALATKVRVWYNYFTFLQEAAGLFQQLQIKALSKVLLALGQIVGGLAALLNVQLPTIFHDFLSTFINSLKFDISFPVGMGCIMKGAYLPGLVANFVLVLAVGLVVFAIYSYQMAKLYRSGAAIDSASGKARAKTLFTKFDKDGDGIDMAELKAVVEKLDPSVSDASAEALFKRADADGSGTIDFQEFYTAISSTPLDLSNLVQRGELSSAEQVQQIFRQFDKDGDGQLGLAEMTTVAQQIDPSISAANVEALFKSADADESGSIDFDEFFAAIATPALNLRTLAEKAEKAEITATAVGRVFLLGFLLYPSKSAHTHPHHDAMSPQLLL
jgi:Ca2+-binding EF-hand superfamily protein